MRSKAAYFLTMRNVTRVAISPLATNSIIQMVRLVITPILAVSRGIRIYTSCLFISFIEKGEGTFLIIWSITRPITKYGLVAILPII